jgi:hypothetical protein
MAFHPDRFVTPPVSPDYIQSFDRSPGHLTFDLDAFDDLAHGNQQLIMFQAYYEHYQ